jgi:HlyD family secretion protein
MMRASTEREVLPEPSLRPLITTALATVSLLFVGVGGWAATTELSGAVIAPGTVVVETSVKKVQHPTGGIVGAILVKEGDKVVAGDPLIRLDDTLTRANLQIINRQLDELEMRGARLELELALGPLLDAKKEFEFPNVLSHRMSDSYVQSLFATEKIAYEARRETCSSQNSQFDERIAQLREEVVGLTDQIGANLKEVGFITEEIGGLEQLEAKQLVTTGKMVERRRQAARLLGEQSQLRASAAQAKGKIAEIELQKLSHFQQQRTDINKERREVQAKLVELKERQIAAEDQLRRTELRSPQTGVVHELSVHTVGGVIEPGEQVMLIVPNNDDLGIEVQIRPGDIDQVSVGQKSALRFTSLNHGTTPEISGTVTRVGADLAHHEASMPSYFVARVSVDSAELKKLHGVKLVPGMPVEVYIETGERTALSFLMKPLSDQASRAFREN